MDDTALIRIETKLDRIATAQNGLQIAVAKQQTRWEQTWPGAILKIDENSAKIACLEIDLAKIKTTVLLWGSLTTTIVVLSIPFISYFLEK